MESQLLLLAEKHPRVWAQTIQQVEAAREYLACPRATAEEYARRLGVSRRTFFRLLRDVSATVSESSQALRDERVSSTTPEARMLIDHAIEKAGSLITPGQAVAWVRASFADAGLPAPARSTIIRRLVVARRRQASVASTPVDIPDLILDHCALGISVNVGTGRQPAYLTALIHGPSGRVLGHHVSDAVATSEHYLAALQDALSRKGPGRRFGALKGVVQRGPGTPFADLLRSAGVDCATFVTSKQTYAFCLARSLTGQIGRIPLLSRHKPGEALPLEVGGSGVPLNIARSVVHLLITKWNSSRCGPSCLRELVSCSVASQLEGALYDERTSPLAAAA